MNKVMLIGNVGVEPDVKYYAADQCVAHVRLATTERGYTLQNGTQVPDHTDWHALTFSRQLAKIVERYVHKGDKLYVEGRIRYSVIEDKRGQRTKVTDILVENMEMLTPKQNSQQTTPNSQQVLNSQQFNPQQNGSAQQQSNTTQQQTPNAPDDDNAIPF